MHRMHISGFMMAIYVIAIICIFGILFKGSTLGAGALILLGTVNDTRIGLNRAGEH
jgi:hypothetical protein